MVTFGRAVALAAAVLVTTSLTGVSPVEAQPVSGLEAKLDAAVAARMAQMGIPGAIVSLSIPGEIDYVRALGVGDEDTRIPVSLDDHTRIGSVTKTFTGTAVLQLVDQGRVRLTDPISQYVDGVPSGDQITLDMLGRMRSGLPNYTESEDFGTRVYQESPLGPDAFAMTPRQIVDEAFTMPVDFAPGARWEYSNTNTVLLGMVVEKVTGIPLEEYLRQSVFGPLGLARTSYPANGVLPGPYLHGYTKAPDGNVYDTTLWNPSWADAAGKIVSNLADLRRWAPAVATGALLRPETHARRLADGSEVVPGAAYAFALFNAHGWIGHNGDIPGYATVAVYLPERNATLVVIANSDIPEPHSAGQLATDITAIATPAHVYQLGPQPPLLVDDDGS